MTVYAVEKIDYEEFYILALFKNESNALRFMKEKQIEVDLEKEQFGIPKDKGYQIVIEELFVEDM